METIEGFYSLFFTGQAGTGFAVLCLNGGSIAGADATGATYDGHYAASELGVVGRITLTVPTGTVLVTGDVIAGQPQSFVIPLSLPPSFANGEPVRIKLPQGPVNVAFKRIRGL